jgi:hypothetical protein
MEVEVNYENPNSGTIHKINDDGIVDQHYGKTKCGQKFTTDPLSWYRWIITNQSITCKHCLRIEDKRHSPDVGDAMITHIGGGLHIFGINTDEKARFATLGSRIRSLLETWEKRALGKIDKKKFFTDIHWDATNLKIDLMEYMLYDGDKRLKREDVEEDLFRRKG